MMIVALVLSAGKESCVLPTRHNVHGVCSYRCASVAGSKKAEKPPYADKIWGDRGS